MEETNAPPSSKELFILAFILLVASPILAIPGGINMAVYCDSPLDDTCENYSDDVPLGTYYPCSNELIGAQVIFALGLTFALLGAAFASAGMYRRRRER